MQSLFDEKTAGRYDSWFLTPSGRYVERVENELIIDLLRPVAGQRLLDVGCGTGNHLLLFHQMGLDVTGLDPSEHMLKLARDKLGDMADLHLGVGEDLPFDDNQFDVVSMISSIEFSSDPAATLAEAFRVARTGVFIGVLNRLSANWIQRAVSSIFKPSIYSNAHFFTIWELLFLVRRAMGNCRRSWGSVMWLPLSFYRWDERLSHRIPRRNNPLGAFLGLYVEIRYSVQSQSHPLKNSWVTGARHKTQPGTLTKTENKTAR